MFTVEKITVTVSLFYLLLEDASVEVLGQS